MITLGSLEVENGSKSSKGRKYLNNVHLFYRVQERLSDRDDSNDCITPYPDSSRIGIGKKWSNPKFVNTINKFDQFCILFAYGNYNSLPVGCTYKLLPSNANEKKIIRFIPENNIFYNSLLSTYNLKTSGSDKIKVLSQSMLERSKNSKYKLFNNVKDKLYLDPIDYTYKDIDTHEVKYTDSPETYLATLPFYYNYRYYDTNGLLSMLKGHRLNIEKFPFYGTKYLFLEFEFNQDKCNEFLDSLGLGNIEYIDSYQVNNNINDYIALSNVSNITNDIDIENKTFTLDNITYRIDNGFVDISNDNVSNYIYYNDKYLVYDSSKINEIYIHAYNNEIKELLKKYISNSLYKQDINTDTSYTKEQIFDTTKCNIDLTQHDITLELLQQNEDELNELNKYNFYEFFNEISNIVEPKTTRYQPDIINYLNIINLNDKYYLITNFLYENAIFSNYYYSDENEIVNNYNNISYRSIIPLSDKKINFHNKIFTINNPIALVYNKDNTKKIQLLDMSYDEFKNYISNTKRTFENLLPQVLYWNVYTGARPVTVRGTMTGKWIPIPIRYDLNGLYSFKYPFGCYNQYDKFTKLYLKNKGDNLDYHSRLETPKWIDKEYKIDNSKRIPKIYGDPSSKFYMKRRFSQNIDSIDNQYQDCNYRYETWQNTARRNWTSVYNTYAFSFLWYLHKDFRDTKQLRDIGIKYFRFLNTKYDFTNEFKTITLYIPDRQFSPFKKVNLSIKKENCLDKDNSITLNNNLMIFVDSKYKCKYTLDLNVYYPYYNDILANMKDISKSIKFKQYKPYIMFSNTKLPYELSLTFYGNASIVKTLYYDCKDIYLKVMEVFKDTKYLNIEILDDFTKCKTFYSEHTINKDTYIEDSIRYLIEDFNNININLNYNKTYNDLVNSIKSCMYDIPSLDSLNINSNYNYILDKPNIIAIDKEYELENQTKDIDGLEYEYQHKLEVRNYINDNYLNSVNYKVTNYFNIKNLLINDYELYPYKLYFYELYNKLHFGLDLEQSNEWNIDKLDNHIPNNQLETLAIQQLKLCFSKEIDNIIKSYIYLICFYVSKNDLEAINALDLSKDIKVLDNNNLQDIFINDLLDRLGIVNVDNTCGIVDYNQDTIDSILASINVINISKVKELIQDYILPLPKDYRLVNTDISNINNLEMLISKMNVVQDFPPNYQGNMIYKFHFLPMFEKFYNKLSWYQKSLVEQLMYYHHIPISVLIPKPDFRNRKKKYIQGILSNLALIAINLFLVIVFPPVGITGIIISTASITMSILSLAIQIVDPFITNESNRNKLEKIANIANKATMVLTIANSIVGFTNINYKDLNLFESINLSFNSIITASEKISTLVFKKIDKVNQEKIKQMEKINSELNQQLQQEKDKYIQDMIDNGFNPMTNFDNSFNNNLDLLSNSFDIDYLGFNFDYTFNIFE